MSRRAQIAARATAHLERRHRYGMEAREAREMDLEVPSNVPDCAVLYDVARAPTCDPDGRVIVSTPGPLCSAWVWFAENHRSAS